jgi:hypothetical protein
VINAKDTSLPDSHTDIKTIGRASCPNLEGYELQPKTSVAIHIRGNNKQCETTNEELNMGNITMPEVEQATHLGIIRTTTMIVYRDQC